MPESIDVREGQVRYVVDPYHGQKTGLFLDQRENRVAAASYARGRALDAFSYNGGFALALSPVCDDVLAVDISEDAVARIAANATRNGATMCGRCVMNVFDELRARAAAASASTPSFSIRRRSQRTKRRCRRRSLATKRSTFERSSCSGLAAFW